MVILHEMAHMWFGDLVTMKWWDDLWLNESFAEFCAFLSSAEATRFTDAWTTFCQPPQGVRLHAGQDAVHAPGRRERADADRGDRELRRDQLRQGRFGAQAAGRVRRPGRASSTGSSSYLADHGWGNATLADLLRALDRELGQVAWPTGRARGWRPLARTRCAAEFEVGADGAFTSFAVLQEAPAEHPTLRPHHIAIGLYNRAGRRAHPHPAGRGRRRPGRARPCRTWLARRSPTSILLNDDDLGYALIRFDQRSLATLTDVDRRVHRLAGPRRVLERGGRHGAARPSSRCPRSSGCWRPAWAASRRSRCCRPCTC